MTANPCPVEVRWQCPTCGRFLASTAIHSEDRIDPGAYYGVTSRTWADCRRCGVVEDPKLAIWEAAS